MTIDKQFPQLLKVFEENKSFVICVPKTVTTDGLCSAVSLYLAFSKAGKQVTIVSETLLTPEVDIIGFEKISTQLQAQGGDTLQLSFPYTEGAVDKVSYDIEGDQFKLVIQPKAGFPKLDPEKVAFGYTGGKIDAIITIECARLDSLGVLYQTNVDKFTGIEIINIDRRFNNTQFGTVNIVEKQTSSIAEIVVSIVGYLKIELDKDTNTNLFTGIVYATNNFSAYSVNADTLETASKLLRAGALKKPYIKQPARSSFMGNQPSPFAPQQSNYQGSAVPPLGPIIGNENYKDDYAALDDEDDVYDDEDDTYNDEEEILPPVQQAQSPAQQIQPSQPTQPMQQPAPQATQTPQAINKPTPASQPKKPTETPEDWLKPKIFKGSSSHLV